jgi:phospholipid-transporting ATPase
LYYYNLSLANKIDQHEDEYGEITNVRFDDRDFFNDMEDSSHENYNNIHLFLQCLVLCNSVMLEHDSKQQGKIIYQTSSPDELALVNAARLFGYVFKDRDINNKVHVQIKGQTIEYELLNMIEYSSERKKMSVIAKCPDGKIRLFTKGADSAIRPHISVNKSLLHQTDEQLLNFAREGLRTLMVAYKEIPLAEYQKWNEKYMNAVTHTQNKDALLEELNNDIERNFYLLGATAIEDRLQDDVSDTLEALVSAGIKIWMLTGDKMDTAKSIANSCKLITYEYEVFELIEGSTMQQIRETLVQSLERLTEGNNVTKHSLIVGMDELDIILRFPNLLDLVRIHFNFSFMKFHYVATLLSAVEPVLNKKL